MITPTRLAPHDSALPQVLTLIQSEFAYMDGLIDPPSSIHSTTLADLQNPGVEVWAMGHPPEACVILTPKPPALYIGKLAVATHVRRHRLATILINHAETISFRRHEKMLQLEENIHIQSVLHRGIIFSNNGPFSSL